MKAGRRFIFVFLSFGPSDPLVINIIIIITVKCAGKWAIRGCPIRRGQRRQGQEVPIPGGAGAEGPMEH